jgi:AraC-like DNA-binding protein
MIFRITDSDLNEIICERNLPPDFKCDHGIVENTSEINHRFGEATLNEVWFEGIHLNYGAGILHNGISLKLESDTPVIEMHFNLVGSQQAYLKGSSQRFSFSSRQHNLFYMPEFEGYFESTPQEQISQMIEVHFTETYFQRLAGAESTSLDAFMKKIQRKELSAMSKHNMSITPYMEILLQQITNCNKQGVLKRLFLESKVMELFMLQMEQFESVTTEQATSLKANDIEKIHHARFLLEQNISSPYSLVELARAVGINDFKLKKGFKEVFGNTVFGYLHEIRMQEAKKLLMDDHKSIHEVSEYCGYQYVQHFSTAFKKKFGVTPGGMRIV